MLNKKSMSVVVIIVVVVVWLVSHSIFSSPVYGLVPTVIPWFSIVTG